MVKNLWVGIALMCLIYWGCKSTNTGVGQHVLDSAQQLGQLSSQNRELTNRLEQQQELYNELRNAISSAEANATGAASDVRGAIELLKQYKLAVDDYFARITALEGQGSPQSLNN